MGDFRHSRFFFAVNAIIVHVGSTLDEPLSLLLDLVPRPALQHGRVGVEGVARALVLPRQVRPLLPVLVVVREAEAEDDDELWRV